MSSKKLIIIATGPILSGTISIAHAKCGKATCRGRQDSNYLHGPYYRWTGWVDGKPPTKTGTEEGARGGQKRIENYKDLQKKIDDTVADALDQAPWMQQKKKGPSQFRLLGHAVSQTESAE